MAESLRKQLSDLATMLVAASPDVLRMAFNEEDDTKDAQPEAAHFIKLSEKRVGRDIEQYGFIGDTVLGWEQTLSYFFEEVVMPLSKAAPASYALGREKLIQMGKEVYTPDLQARWEELLAA